MTSCDSRRNPTKLAPSKATGEFSNKQLVVHSTNRSLVLMFFLYDKTVQFSSFFLLLTETDFSVSISVTVNFDFSVTITVSINL